MDRTVSPAPEASEFDRLAAHFGIAPEFENAHGQKVHTSRQVRERLLKSMGVHAADNTEAAKTLCELQAREALEALPPVVVITPDAQRRWVDVTVAPGTGPLHWRVRLEDGSTQYGTTQACSEGQTASIRVTLPELPLGYHLLELPELSAETTLIVSPGTCWLPPEAGAGIWGIAVQLYLLRSATNWGIGDFSDLARLVEIAGARGCAVLGLNPLHQMFLDDPEEASPYSPATRLFLNPLYIDVTRVPEFCSSEEAQELVASERFQTALTAARAAPLVDYSAVVALKIEALQVAFRTFSVTALETRRAAFIDFCEDKGTSLARASLFQVLRQHFSSLTPGGRNWRNWSPDLQDPASEAAQQFADEHRHEVIFQNWLQFLADDQLREAAEAARRAGMSVGLYRDLAVGCQRWGAETWANPTAFLEGAMVGAPPDIHNPAGQDWGLPPFDPMSLRREGYRSFRELIRENMRHAGGLRIDHVMGMSRLYCIPEGATPAEGAYVGYPLEELIAVLALESQRTRCLVVGEDLGTVPHGFREMLAAANILSYRVLFFEQDSKTGTYVPPESYPELALAMTGSHDLPTLLAWWEGADITIKDRLGCYPSPSDVTEQRERRARDRKAILEAFFEAGLLTETPAAEEVSAARFTELAHGFLAMTPSALIATQLDDLTGDAEPVNIPGTTTEHPNWRRKYSMALEDIASNDSAWELARRLARPGSVRA